MEITLDNPTVKTVAPSPNYDNVVTVLQLFFPQLFDPQSPQYVDPDTLTQLIALAEESRPWCLPTGQQDLAQAYFTAYLVSLRNETMAGGYTPPVAGPIVSEREGDIQVTYAQSTNAKGLSNLSNRPPSDPWDVWNRFWVRCGVGAITTRFGDPCKSATQLTFEVIPIALNIWRPIW